MNPFADVTVYTKPGCDGCSKAIKHLEHAGVSVDVVDVTLDENAYNYVTQMLGAKSVPVIVADYGEIYGYQPEQVSRLIELIKGERTVENTDGIHDYVWGGE